jgi:ABC-type glycerol-3-phosphate transport system substrate-binding protein
MWGLQYDPHVEAYQRLSDLFAEQGGGTFEVQPQAWPIPPKVIAALAAGTQPDVACIMGEQLTSLHLHQARTADQPASASGPGPLHRAGLQPHGCRS